MARIMWFVRATLLVLLTVMRMKESLGFPSTAVRATVTRERTTRAKVFSSRTSSGTRRIWRERADPKQHLDFMVDRTAGGWPVEASRDNLHSHYVYFLRLDSKFCFVFQGIAQVDKCRRYFSRKIHPHTRNDLHSDHAIVPWYCRLPKGITDTKRQWIVKQLNVLMERYGQDHDFVHEQRYAANKGFHDRTDRLEERKKKRALYRENLLHQLRQQPSDVHSLVWTAIEKEVCPDRKSKKPVKELLSSQIGAAQKVVDRIPLPPQAKMQFPMGEMEPAVRLSKRRRKINEKQRLKDLDALNEVACPIYSFSTVLEDTREVMIDFPQEQKGSSNQDFQVLLEELVDYERQMECLRKPIRDLYSRLERGI